VSSMPDLDARITAAELLRTAATARPRQAVEVTGAEGGPIETTARVDLSGLSLEERDQLEALLERAAPPMALPSLSSVQAERCRTELGYFTRQAWQLVEPGRRS
jgi:hypothetical protein